MAFESTDSSSFFIPRGRESVACVASLGEKFVVVDFARLVRIDRVDEYLEVLVAHHDVHPLQQPPELCGGVVWVRPAMATSDGRRRRRRERETKDLTG